MKGYNILMFLNFIPHVGNFFLHLSRFTTLHNLELITENRFSHSQRKIWHPNKYNLHTRKLVLVTENGSWGPRNWFLTSEKMSWTHKLLKGSWPRAENCQNLSQKEHFLLLVWVKRTSSHPVKKWFIWNYKFHYRFLYQK